MFHKSCHLSRWNSLFGSFNENRFGAQLCVIHTIARYLYDSVTNGGLSQILDKFQVRTFLIQAFSKKHHMQLYFLRFY